MTIEKRLDDPAKEKSGWVEVGRQPWQAEMLYSYNVSRSSIVETRKGSSRLSAIWLDEQMLVDKRGVGLSADYYSLLMDQTCWDLGGRVTQFSGKDDQGRVSRSVYRVCDETFPPVIKFVGGEPVTR